VEQPKNIPNRNYRSFEGTTESKKTSKTIVPLKGTTVVS